ncbi:MAG: sigma-70 family RNA polymerase sigma factor [Firmicutes bacterium]|nr:sigma-70 family RNA polymerase sigma factor [Bacillota bacterium]
MGSAADAVDKESARQGFDNARRLLAQAQAGDPAAEGRLVEMHLGLARKLASRFVRPGYDAEDLFQIACVGLVKAIRNFDLGQPVQFSTYAVPVILGELRAFLRSDGPVKVSRSVRELARQVHQQEAALEQALGRRPTAAEVAQALGVDAAAVVEALEAVQTPASLEAPLAGERRAAGSTEEPTLGEVLAAGEGSLQAAGERVALRQALAALPERHRRILWRRYVQERSQMEVAASEGISQAQISRLERQALRALRALLGEE